MIVTCPACQTRYLVDDNAIDAGGRSVRCAACGHLWRHQHDAAPSGEDTVAATAPSEAAETSLSAAPGSAPTAEPFPEEPRIGAPPLTAGPRAEAPLSPSVADEPPPAPRRGRAWIGALAAVVLVAVVVLAAILGREQIIAMWPSARPFYAALHLVGPPGAGLEVTVTPTRTADSLVINGDIVNGATVARRIPRLRITLRDGNKTDLVSKVIDPPVARLPPGATAHFNTVFEHPSIAATGVAVSFATD